MAKSSGNAFFPSVMIFLVVTLNLADRQIINILAQDIKVDLGLSDAQLGLLTGSAFGVIYVIAGIPIARLADRADRPRLIAAMLAIWSLCTIACGAAGGFIALFLARMGVGAGEGGAQPTCTSYIRDLHPTRATSALAVMMAGHPFGSFLGFMVGGAIAQHWGWRSAFVLAGLPGLLVALLIAFGIREPRPSSPQAGQRGLWRRDMKRLLRNPSLPLLMVLCSASLLIIYSGSAWFPAYFIRVHRFTTGEIGAYAAVAVGVGGGAGTLAGILCDRFRERLVSAEIKFLILAFAGLLPCTLWTLLAPSAASALAGLLAFNLFAYACLAPTTRLIQDAVEPHERARYGLASIRYAAAIVMTAAALAGLLGSIALKRQVESAGRSTGGTD
ncbi:MAG: MFS transporter [Alphaproteobacteria bacterium]|nr:MAG: MFS transporter [Alphaproteobacteria bacterium]